MVQSCPFTLDDNSIRILWEITSKCNLKCKHCLYYSSVTKAEPDMTTEEIFHIIDDISNDQSVKAIWLSGGEPLLKDDLFDIISKISSCGIKPSLSTNGTLIPNNEYAIELHKRGVDYVHLSIDGVTANVHDGLRNVPGAFDKVMKAVNYLNQAGIIVGVTFIVTKQSINSVEKMIELAINKNVQVLSFYLVEPIGRGKNFNIANRFEVMSELNEIIKKAMAANQSDLRIELFRTVKANGEEYLKNCKGYNFLTITNSGELGACPWFVKSQDIVKKVSLKGTSFIQAKEIVQSSMRSYLEERVNHLQQCKQCRHINYCGKGCPAVSGFDVADPLCEYIR